MKENELVELGFERTDVTAEESGYDRDWYYYTYDFGKGALSLISCDSTEAEREGKWYAEIFEDETIRFTSKIELMQFIRLVERNTIKK